jgi:serine/threonine-protein kinase
MASLHLGRVVGENGFSRVVAMKMLANGPTASSFGATALKDEARIAARIRHPNVVQPHDVLSDGRDLVVVMDYVHGVSFDRLLANARERGELVDAGAIVAIVHDVLSGLHAAHEAVDERGRPLGIVHRDVSPSNVLVGVDGLARLADFGVARAATREIHTEAGVIKGKVAYMAPEQRRGLPVTRQADLYAVGVLLAEALTGSSPPIDNGAEWLAEARANIPDRNLASVVEIATNPSSAARYATAGEMMAALSASFPRATSAGVARAVSSTAADELELREELIRRVETVGVPASDPPPIALSVRTAPIEVRSKRRRSTAALLVGIAGCMLVAAVRGSTGQGRASAASAPAEIAMPAPEPPKADEAPKLEVRAAAEPADAPKSRAPSSSSASPPPIKKKSPARTVQASRASRGAPQRDAPQQEAPHAPAQNAELDEACSPPYVLDENGKKHFKRECFQ